MKITQMYKEIFYFPFYFVSLNIAGLVSFYRFLRRTQPPMWKKGNRLAPSLRYSKARAHGKYVSLPYAPNYLVQEEEDDDHDDLKDYANFASVVIKLIN